MSYSAKRPPGTEPPLPDPHRRPIRDTSRPLPPPGDPSSPAYLDFKRRVKALALKRSLVPVIGGLTHVLAAVPGSWEAAEERRAIQEEGA